MYKLTAALENISTPCDVSHWIAEYYIDKLSGTRAHPAEVHFFHHNIRGEPRRLRGGYQSEHKGDANQPRRNDTGTLCERFRTNTLKHRVV